MKFRFARHTNDLDKLKLFYTNILGFEVLGSFENHNNYDGIFLGKQNLDWHLEFTQTDEIVAFNFNEDDILVFYPETIVEYDVLIENISKNNINIITSKNPFWNTNGKMILDTDGYRIVISNLKAK
jgi:extradiol dioxygenase family protein